MADEKNVVQSNVPVDFNPFSDEPYKAADEVPVAIVPNTENAASTDPPASEPIGFDPNSFVKEKFGFENLEEAETAIKNFREQKQNQFEFKDDNSKRLFDAIQEGKTDDVYNILNEQKKLEKLTTGELNSNLAVDIIKTDLLNKYKELTSDEVDILFYEKYNFPKKPEQDLSDTDEEYEDKVKGWQSQVDFLEKRMIIDAKVLRPELAKLKGDLVLPDVYNRAALQKEAEQRELDSEQQAQISQQARVEYEKALDLQYNSFEGYNVSVKDEEVDIPISFAVSQEERLAIKQELSDFDGIGYLENRWFTKEGKPNVTQAMSDKYVLENLPKILQKVANEAASQMKLHLIKKSGNITVGGQTTPQGTVPNTQQDVMNSLAEWAFKS